MRYPPPGNKHLNPKNRLPLRREHNLFNQMTLSLSMSLFSARELDLVIYPLLDKITKQYRKQKAIIIGIQGGPGTGKTTLIKQLAELLKSKGFKVQSFSLDDFYSSNRERKQLARRYSDNAFYQIPRGMPGTHRIGLLKKTLQDIKAGQNFKIPFFDKSLYNGDGDISPDYREIVEQPDFILFEGWCLGLPLFTLTELKRICRKHNVNLQKLDPCGRSTKILLDFTERYQSCWKLVDYWIQLIPDFSDLHLRWRLQQEQELIQKREQGMSLEQIRQFVSVFLPLTYVCYEKLKANARIKINVRHEFYDLKVSKSNFLRPDGNKQI